MVQTAQSCRGRSRRSTSANASRPLHRASKPADIACGEPSSGATRVVAREDSSYGPSGPEPSSKNTVHEILQHHIERLEPSVDTEKSVSDDMELDWSTVTGRKRRTRSVSPRDQPTEYVVEVCGKTDHIGDLDVTVMDVLQSKLGEECPYSIFQTRDRAGTLVSFRSLESYSKGIQTLQSSFRIIHY